MVRLQRINDVRLKRDRGAEATVELGSRYIEEHIVGIRLQVEEGILLISIPEVEALKGNDKVQGIAKAMV